MVRKTSGEVYCRATLVATKPEPQITTKVHASAALTKRSLFRNFIASDASAPILTPTLRVSPRPASSAMGVDDEKLFERAANMGCGPPPVLSGATLIWRIVQLLYPSALLAVLALAL